MLKERGVAFRYREYTLEPLSEQELGELFRLLGLEPRDLLRMRDAKKLGLTGSEPAGQLLSAMAGTPGLLQRPILVGGGRAVVGRPIEQLEAFLAD